MSTQRGASPASPSPPPPPRSPLKWLKSRRRSASPDSTCPICLSEVVNKSVTNTCMHEFCFCCLQEWSKIKAECPLCKQRFSKIYHTIKSMDVYQEHILETAGSSAGGIGILDPILINFQILTNARLRAPLMLLFPPREHSSRSSSRLGVSGSNAPVPPESIVTRRRIYDQNLWALPLRSQRTAWRVRESSPQFYRTNPAQTHRLIPWLLRELHVLLGTTTVDISVLINSIMQAIQMYPIRSRHFASRMRTYLGENTAHFVHEFYRFAVAPFDMDLYDMCVEYTSFNNDLARSVETASDSDSDVEIVRVHTHLNTQRTNVPVSSSTSINHHSSPNGRSSSGRQGRTASCPFFASSSQNLDRDGDNSPLSNLLATPSPSLSSLTYYDSERVLSQNIDDEGDISSVSTILASPVLSSLNRSPEVIVIGSSPSYAGSASPSYSSDSDIQILSPPPRPTPIVITLDESSEEDSKVGVKTEQSSEPECTAPLECIAGPSTSGQVVEYTTLAARDSFALSSSDEPYQSSKRKKKRKLKSKQRRLPPKKRSKGWTTSDESETESSKPESPVATRRMSKYTTKRKHRLVSSSSSS